MNLVYSDLSMKYYHSACPSQEIKKMMQGSWEKGCQSRCMYARCAGVCVCVGYHAKQQFSVDLAFLFQLNQRQNLLGKHRLVKIIPLLVAFETSASLTVPLAACFLIGPYGRKVAKVWILAGCFGNIIGLSLVILGAMLAILLATYTLT